MGGSVVEGSVVEGSVVNDSGRDSQLSAMFDGELPAAECELLARRLSRDPQLKQQWSRYALIGAVVRGEPLGARRPAASAAPGVLGSMLAERVAHSVVAEATQGSGGAGDAAPTAPPVVVPDRAARWARPLAGAAIAASVAALAVFWVQRDGGRGADGAAVTIAASASPAANGAGVPVTNEVVLAAAAPAATRATGELAAASRNPNEPESYVVPLPGQRTALASSAQLANYVVAHSEYSAPLTRRSLLSALMATEAAEASAAAAAAGPASEPGAPKGNAAAERAAAGRAAAEPPR
jgi:negative regulator of sigma E activity